MTVRARPTLAHVAKRAHVSVTTASAALRGAAGVNEQTRQRVIAAATAIGYRADSAAAALRSGRGGMIGMIIEPSGFGGDPGDPELFWPRLLNGFTRTLTASGFGVAIVPSNDARVLAELPVRALVSYSTDFDDWPDSLPFGLPVIYAGGERGGPTAVAAAVHDYRAIAGECITHLQSVGAAGLGFVVSPADPAVFHHLANVFAAEAAEAGMPLMTCDSMSQVITRIVESRVDAVVAGGQADARRLLAALTAAGIAVPGDVRVLTLSEGDIEHGLDPAVSSMSFMGAACGQAIGDLVVRGLATNEFASIRLPHRLDPRCSTIGRP